LLLGFSDLFAFKADDPGRVSLKELTGIEIIEFNNVKHLIIILAVILFDSQCIYTLQHNCFIFNILTHCQIYWFQKLQSQFRQKISILQINTSLIDVYRKFHLTNQVADEIFGNLTYSGQVFLCLV